MKHGDFTGLAKYYNNRPGYSLQVLKLLACYARELTKKEKLTVADVGAGTGKLTEELARIGLGGYAVEPNAAMRAEGVHSDSGGFVWSGGSAEETGLESGCVDWVLMGSSFHWTEAPRALEEFNRILRPEGMFTAIWNPRDVEKNELHQTIERKIREIVPEMVRVSSGSGSHMKGLEEKLLQTPYFGELFFVEAPFDVEMTPQRYLDAWKSVNDIQVQAGEARFAQILDMISRETAGLSVIPVPYKARAWTVVKQQV